MTRRDSPRATLRRVILSDCSLQDPCLNARGRNVWGATLMIPVRAYGPHNLSAMNRIVQSAKAAGAERFGKKWLRTVGNDYSVSNGDDPIIIRGRSLFAIDLQDSHHTPLDLDDYEIDGSECSVRVRAYPYAGHWGGGVGFSLSSVWITQLPRPDRPRQGNRISSTKRQEQAS